MLDYHLSKVMALHAVVKSWNLRATPGREFWKYKYFAIFYETEHIFSFSHDIDDTSR